MNENLLNALMELIALFAKVNNSRFIDNAHSLLKTYLEQTVSIKNSRVHIRRFYDYLDEFSKQAEPLPADDTSLKQQIDRIVKNINSELNGEERLVLFLSFLELIKLDKKIDPEELHFAEILSFELHISRNDYKNSLVFILSEKVDQELNPDFLIITNAQSNNLDELEGTWIEQNRPFENDQKLLLIKDGLQGEVLILYFHNINYLAGRYFGNQSIHLNSRRVLPGKFFLIGQFDQLRFGETIQCTYQEIVSGFKSHQYTSALKFVGENISTKKNRKSIGIAPFNFSEELGNLVIVLCNDANESRNISLLLSGQLPLSSGRICLNGYDIISDKYKVHKMIGFVPRENIFDENISIYNNFRFSARLAFPGYSDHRIDELVYQTISSLGLTNISNIPVKRIDSGIPAEYLRVLINTGAELIRDPFILILDLSLEKLNSSNAEEFCNIIKAEANKGKLILITTVNPGACVLKRTDKMWIFDSKGFIIYRGHANLALSYFKDSGNSIVTGEVCPFCGNVNTDQLYQIIHAKVLDNNGRITHVRKISPEEWYAIYKKKIEENEPKHESRKIIPSYASSIPNVNVQFSAYLKKSLQSFFANPYKHFLILIAGWIIGFLISGLLRYDWTSNFTFSGHEYLPLLFFLNTVICFVTGTIWGLNSTLKDKLHLAFDHFKNYNFFSFLNVKYIFLTITSLLFSFLFTSITDFVSGINGLFLLNWMIYFSMMFIGGSFGFLFGYISRHLRAALFITAMLFTFNILFSGYIVPYNSLPKPLASYKYTPFFAEIFPGRWAYEALVVQQVKDNGFQKKLFKTEQTISDLTFKTSILIPKLQEIIYNIQEKNDLSRLTVFPKELVDINRKYPDIFQFEFLKELNKKKVNAEILSELEDYVRYVQFQLYEKLNESLASRNNLRKVLKDSIGEASYDQLFKSCYNPP
ncbi:MAG TPA: ABC transporter permease, partial [Bacteroidales bacterium]|nr:ABC transporter permease [Bacteroidales bacterium]